MEEKEVKKVVKKAFMDARAKHICMSVRLKAESQSDNVSITHVVERLDIETMLNRAMQGILDLRTYQRPMVADVVGAGGTPEQIERATMQLLEEPDTPETRVFGVDKETAVHAIRDLYSLADQYKVTKKEEQQPGGTKDKPDEVPTPPSDDA